jgi:hypothetical protein
MSSGTANERPRIAWSRLLVEAVAIVVSILLAFSLDAWWQSTSDAREEQSILEDLDDELAVVYAALTGIISATAAQESGAERLASTLGASQASVSVSDSLLALLFNDITFNPSLGSYDALISSGRIDLIKAQDLQNGLATWPSILDDAVEEQLRLQRFGDSELKPLVEATSQDLSGTYAVLAQWESDKQIGAVGPHVTVVAPSTKLSNMIQRRIYFLRIIEAELANAATHVEASRAMIRRERGYDAPGSR